MNLEEYLKEYKALTLDIMEQINTDGNIKILLSKRDEILHHINELKFDNAEIKEIGNSLGLLDLEMEMRRMVDSEKVNIKRRIQELKKKQQGNRQYLSSAYSNFGQSRFDKRF